MNGSFSSDELYCSRNIMDQLIAYDDSATVIMKWCEKNRQTNSLFIFYSYIITYINKILLGIVKY